MGVVGARWMWLELGGCGWSEMDVVGARWVWFELGGCSWS